MTLSLHRSTTFTSTTASAFTSSKYLSTLPSILLTLFLILQPISSYQLLNQIPITFSISGNISYTPTSGGANIQGYILKIGYYKYPWIGIKFMTLTSRSTYDILIIKRQSSAIGGYYKTTVSQYFVASGRQDKLISDSINNMDRQTQAYTNNNYFQVQIYRTKGDTQGQDWEGGQFIYLCFMTSPNQFTQSTWNNGIMTNCYGYDISIDYVSTFRGKYIGSMSVDGLSSRVYGGIQGPVLRMQLFWYCVKPTLSSSDIYFKYNQKISQELGYDFYKCNTQNTSNSGDYFGNIGSQTPDTLWSGYDDGTCTVVSSLTSTKISYKRNIYTSDQYDAKIYNQTEICIRVGGREDCQVLKLEFLFPVMEVDSALVIYQGWVRRVMGVVFGMVGLMVAVGGI